MRGGCRYELGFWLVLPVLLLVDHEIYEHWREPFGSHYRHCLRKILRILYLDAVASPANHECADLGDLSARWRSLEDNLSSLVTCCYYEPDFSLCLVCSTVVCGKDLWFVDLEMKCPECLQRIHDHAEECPHCGMCLEQLSPRFEGIKLEVNDGVHDVAGVLSLEMRKQMRAEILRCEKQFVGVNIAVSFVALRDGQSLEGYGFWLLNRGKFFRGSVEYSEIEDGRGRVILVVDMESKRAALCYGYYFDGYVREKENIEVLSKGHASLLEGEILQGCEQILIALKELLKKAVLRSRKGVKR